jgi:hypothetical protein
MADADSRTLRSILVNLILAKTSLVYLLTDEDRRVETEIKNIASSFKPPLRSYVWTCTSGVTLDDQTCRTEPGVIAALDWFMRLKETAFLTIFDAHVFVQDNMPVIRKLKDVVKRVENGYKTVFLVSPELAVPPELSNDVVLVDVPLPDHEEVERILDGVIAREKHAEALKAAMVESVRDLFIKGGVGLTSQQATQAFRKALAGKANITEKEIDILYEEKRQIVKKSGLLELFRQGTGFADLGGFANLKKWLEQRKDIFSRRARDYGLTLPKGVLLMGISGCGKSLCVKAIADFWKIPLLRLDMGRIYDGIHGAPEECFRKVIKISEASAPCVLWIDEIEAGIANAGQKALGGSASRVLAGFLTWMQEKTSPVFVGATANSIELLPPEILRKGRFDELFYVELPSDEERDEIIRIHLSRKNIPTSLFNFEPLVKITQGFNGAEIEQGVLAGIFRAFTEGREIEEKDLQVALEAIVPLSQTMMEQIKALERWAHNRAVKAGKG